MINMDMKFARRFLNAKCRIQMFKEGPIGVPKHILDMIVMYICEVFQEGWKSKLRAQGLI